VVAYELCAGRRPTPRTYMPLSAVDSSLGGLDPIIQKGLAPASTRYKTPKDFADDLRAWKARVEIRTAAGPNPLASSFRDKLIKQQQERDQEKKRREEEAARIRMEWTKANDIVFSGAALAFEDMHRELHDLLPNATIKEIDGEPKWQGNYAELLRMESGDGRPDVVFMLSKDESNGIPSFSGKTLSSKKNHNDGQLTARNGYFTPFWVVCRQHGKQQHVEGVVVLNVETKLVAKPMTVWSGSLGTRSDKNEPIESVEDARAYVTKAIGAALHLDRE
jgi:hypothetical protein